MTEDLTRKRLWEVAMDAKAPTRVAAAAVLDEYAKRILVALLAEAEALRDLGPALEGGASRELAELRDLGIPYRPVEWCDAPLSCASRMAYSRATAQLEHAGLLSRVTDKRRNRVRYLRLTPAGLCWGLQLVGRRADPAAVAEGLRRTTWGKSLAAVVYPRSEPGTR